MVATKNVSLELLRNNFFYHYTLQVKYYFNLHGKNVLYFPHLIFPLGHILSTDSGILAKN